LQVLLFFLIVGCLFFAAFKDFPKFGTDADWEMSNTFTYQINNTIYGVHYVNKLNGAYGPTSLAMVCLLLISMTVYLTCSIVSFVKIDKNKRYFIYSMTISALFLVFSILVFCTLITTYSYNEENNHTTLVIGMFEYSVDSSTGDSEKTLSTIGGCVAIGVVVDLIVCGTLGGLALKSYFKNK